jgi:coproporphyrinogen III oxidase-like Fe-S oxidoreductase
LIFGLRKRSGVSIPELEKTYGFNFNQRYGRTLERYFDENLMTLENNQLRLQPEAIPVSNEILAVFLND